MGTVGRRPEPKGYVSWADVAAGMDTYNQALLDVCQEDGLECFDLAPIIPKHFTYFYDDIHFNEAGAKMAGQRIAEYLLTKEPFAPSAEGTPGVGRQAP